MVFSLLNYQDDARPHKHKIHNVVVFILWDPTGLKSVKQFLQCKIIIKELYKIVKVGCAIAGCCEVQVLKLYVVNTKISSLSKRN